MSSTQEFHENQTKKEGDDSLNDENNTMEKELDESKIEGKSSENILHVEPGH